MFLLRKDSQYKSDPRYIEEVRDWQRFLISQGYDLGHSGADGDFGDYTYKATCDFQSAQGVEPIDGKAGEQTFTSAAKLGFQSGLDAPPDEIIGTTKLRAVKGIDKVSDDFKRKVIDIAGNLGTDPNYLLAVMSFETGHSFSPSVRNKASGATGLIQFMPKTAQSLGTTTDKLAAMTAERQLDFVETYFQPYKGKLNNIEDCYMAVLWPKAVGKPNHYVLFSAGSSSYKLNKGLDRDGDGKVTKAEAASKVAALLIGASKLPSELGLVNEVLLSKGDKGPEVDEAQQILVRLGFLTDADYKTGPGVFGNRTEAAVREFQHAYNLDTGGRITKATRDALRATLKNTPDRTHVDPQAISTLLPAAGNGFQTYNREQGGKDQYGRKHVIEALILLGEKWHALHDDCPVQYGDISRKGGGHFPPHAGHRNGIDVDIRPFRKDKHMLPENCNNGTYSRSLTQEFVGLVRLHFPQVTIFFNDTQLVKAGLTAHASGHDNHLHIRF